MAGGRQDTQHEKYLLGGYTGATEAAGLGGALKNGRRVESQYAQHQSFASTQVKLNRSATLGGAIKVGKTVTTHSFVHQKTRVFSQ